MKGKLLLLSMACAVGGAFAQWSPQGDKIKTQWAEKIDVNNVLPEYPRPIMERADWQNLNGLWQYAIRPVGEAAPADYDGQILVPFAVESSLSGVMKRLGSENELWYERTFTVPSGWKGKNVLLHFGAVDWSFLSPVAYIRNFELTPHADLSLLSGGRTGNGKLYSVGADLCVRLGNLLWIPFDTRIGISYNYNGGSFMDALLDADYERSPHSIGFVFSIDL